MNIPLWIVVFVCTSLYIDQSESEAGAAIPIKVGRRHMKDFYVPLNSEFNTICDSVNNTYLVSQRTCVKNEELFSSKYFKSFCTVQSSEIFISHVSLKFTQSVALQ